MKSKERVLRAIEFRGPDRTPLVNPLPGIGDVFFMTIYPAAEWQPLPEHAPYMMDALYLIGNWRWRGHAPWDLPGSHRKREDEFGVVREALTADNVGEPTFNPLKNIEDAATFQLPDPHCPERFETFERLTKLIARDMFVIGDLGLGLWERAHFLRGFTEMMEDLALRPEHVERLLDRLVDEWFSGLAREYAARGCDAVLFTDDWGMQERLMISPAMWRRIFKPRYARLFAVAHEVGLKTIMHSCGRITDILDDLIEAGLDVLQKDDIEVVGSELVREKYAGRLCFMSTVDVQRVMPGADVPAIARETKKLIRRLSTKDGGLIGHFNMLPRAIGLRYWQFFLMQLFMRLYGSAPVQSTRM